MRNARLTWPEVFEEEIEIVSARRGESCDEVKEKLVGLAISGGGIRSATYGLGVLEGLKNHGLLPKLDYLSTVSGGGYIGAWLSANCRRAAEGNRLSWLDRRADWKLSIDHLRRYSNYLSPTLGFFSADTWSMAAIWVRNTILVQLTVMLAITVALLVPRPLQLAFRHWPEVGNWRWATIFLFILGAVGIAGNHFRFAFKGRVRFLEAGGWYAGLIGAAVSLGSAATLGAVFHFEPFSGHGQNLLLSCVMALLLIGGGFCLQPVAVKLVSLVWRGTDPPERINYTQAWVQALVVIPMLAIGFLVGAILWGESLLPHGNLSELTTFGEFFKGAWHFWPFPLAVVFLSLWLFSICSIRNYRDLRCWGAALMAPIPAMLVLHALLSAIMLLLHNWATKGGEQGQWMAYIWAPPMVLYALSVSIVMLIGMLGRQSCEAVREWWSRCGAWLGIYGFGWMLISIAVVYGPLLSAWLFQAGTWGVSISGGWIATTLAGLFAGNSSSSGKTPPNSNRKKLIEVIARVAPFVFIAGLLVAVSTVLHLIIASNSGLVWKGARQLQHDHWMLMGRANHRIEGFLLAGCFLALLVLAARVDINEFGLNAFYRNRLIRCYLGATRFHPGERQPQNFTGFDDDDEMQLAQQLQTSPAGPFHIINCALNLGGSKDLALHTRHSANFTLTPLTCGSSYLSSDQTGVAEEVGYSRTATYGGAKAPPTLGQAIAVSGAAASPNMGYHTSPTVAFLLTLFNVRLGWWFPSPKAACINNPSPWFSLRYMFMELFGGANDKSSYLAISDGGHFENLAAYELVRRKCKVIIISDGECDADLKFDGLGTLIRMCDVDFDAKITIDVNSIRPGESIWSCRRSAVGSIDYADRSRGTLIYLKASMIGQEDTAVLQYKASHPAFPHESTGNQFYAENQFESYRSLGRDIAMRLFEPVADEKNFDTMIYKLEKICSPTLYAVSQSSQHSKYLVDLWSKLRENPDLHSLDREFTTSWPDASGQGFRDAFYLCSEMIKLMENVYVELRLEDNWEHPENAGWKTMFQRWSESPSLQRTWALNSETHSQRFQYFCERRLGLPVRAQAAAAHAN